MSTLSRIGPLALAAAVAAGCSSADLIPTVAAGTGPSHLIQDAANNGGKAGFYFLPPMVSHAQTSGTFDADLSPDVEICSGGRVDYCSLLVRFNRGNGLTMDPDGEYYAVNWQTNDYDLQAGQSYRIRVVVHDIELGKADVYVGENGADLKNVNTDEYIPLVDGRTLRIKFRIERGFVAGLGIVPSFASVPAIGSGQKFTAALVDLHGASLADVTSGATWSTDPYVAGVDEDGYAVAIGAGNATIRASYGGATATAHLNVAASGLRFTDLTAREGRTCALSSFQAYCWGLYLTSPQSSSRHEPVPVLGLVGLSQVMTSIGSSFGQAPACGLTIEGTAHCWGGNERGELGRGTTSLYEFMPAPVRGGLTFTSITGGGSHTCGIATAGAAYCWGYGAFGALGTGNQESHLTPTPVVGGLAFIALTAGGSFTCGVTTDLAAYCWGRMIDRNGELKWEAQSPTRVADGMSFKAISAGYQNICALATDDTAWCWGDNFNGQLGDGTTVYRLLPVAAAPALRFKAMSIAGSHSCGLTVGGDAYCWGLGLSGQLGDGASSNSLTPVLVTGGLRFEKIVTGSGHTCGLTGDEVVYCWGSNQHGQQGNSSLHPNAVPTRVP